MTELSTPREAALPRPRLRRAITAILTILLAVMIVRDIIGRRWSSPPPPNVTERPS